MKRFSEGNEGGRRMKKQKIWECKIGECDNSNVPDGGDFPMREAIVETYIKITGKKPTFCFSGWGAELDEIERGVVTHRQAEN